MDVVHSSFLQAERMTDDVLLSGGGVLGGAVLGNSGLHAGMYSLVSCVEISLAELRVGWWNLSQLFSHVDGLVFACASSK